MSAYGTGGSDAGVGRDAPSDYVLYTTDASPKNADGGTDVLNKQDIVGGGPAALAITPSSPSFTGYVVGCGDATGITAASAWVTITNLGGVSSGIVTLTGLGAGWQVWQDCLGAPIQPGASCQIAVENYTATTPGQVATAITIGDGVVSATATIVGTFVDARSCPDAGLVKNDGGTDAIPAVTDAGSPNGVFTPTGGMTTSRIGHAATRLGDGRVVLAGGSDLASVELFDPVTGKFIATGSTTTSRYALTTTLLKDGRVLIAGQQGDAELFDPATGTVTITGSMTTWRGGHTATRLNDGKVLIAGGQDPRQGPLPLSAELYDPATGTFDSTGSMATGRYSPTATLLSDGKVLIAGGQSSASSSYGLASAELYDPATGTFASTGGNMTLGRCSPTATLLSDGKVLITGGYGGSSSLLSAELYDPTAGTFFATGSMTTARYWHTATLLNNGKVLITGGTGGTSTNKSAYLATAELYDPAAGRFTTAGIMSTQRAEHTSTLLPSGDVLLAGGSDGSSALASAELYALQE
jgi:hypothetical protein